MTETRTLSHIASGCHVLICSYLGHDIRSSSGLERYEQLFGNSDFPNNTKLITYS